MINDDFLSGGAVNGATRLLAPAGLIPFLR